MKILFDVNTPSPLARWLRGHDVALSINLGWQSLKNGKLLDAAEGAGFDVLVTCDQSIPYQQNFTGRKLAIEFLSTNRWPMLRPLAARIATAVDFAQRGQICRIEIDSL